MLRVDMDGPLGESPDLDTDEVRKKFAMMAGGHLAADGVRRVVGLVDELDQLPSLSPLFEILRKSYH